MAAVIQIAVVRSVEEMVPLLPRPQLSLLSSFIAAPFRRSVVSTDLCADLCVIQRRGAVLTSTILAVVSLMFCQAQSAWVTRRLVADDTTSAVATNVKLTTTNSSATNSDMKKMPPLSRQQQ